MSTALVRRNAYWRWYWAIFDWYLRLFRCGPVMRNPLPSPYRNAAGEPVGGFHGETAD